MGKVLSERRAADRQEMAKLVEAVITECGATFVRKEGGTYPGPRAIYLEVRAARGLSVLVDFDGDSIQLDEHVLSWHFAHDADKEARLNAATFGGNVNPHHQRKATYAAYGIDELCMMLRRGLRMAQTGEAFVREERLAA